MSQSMFTNPLRRFVVGVVERAGGSKVVPDLSYLARTQRMSRDELLALRWRKLEALLEHAYENVPYYKRVFDGEGLTPVDIRGPDDFKRLPLLTKKQIRENITDLAARSVAGRKVVTAQTGGTTGEPLKFLRDTDCNSFTRAALLRSYTWTGYRIGDPMLFLTGGSLLRAPQTVKQRLGFGLMNYYFMPGFRLRNDTLEPYVQTLQKKRIKFLRGYSTLLHQFAELCENKGFDGLKLTAVYPTAEMLTTAQRETIERVFGARVFDHYGCAEINAIANECPEARKLHTIDEHVYVEETDDNDLVLTDLDNYAQPFIRYTNGDRGKLGVGVCQCGRNLTVLEEFLGRSSDAIVLAGGERYPGVFFHHLFGHFPGVTQFQVVQKEAGRLTIKIIRNQRYAGEDEAQIKKLVAEHTSIDPHIEYTDEIPRSPSGKITSVISEVAEID